MQKNPGRGGRCVCGKTREGKMAMREVKRKLTENIKKNKKVNKADSFPVNFTATKV